MKKIISSVFLSVAIVSFGGIMSVGLAHADTSTSALTPAEQATLQETVDGLKEQVLLLEAQAAAQGAPTQPTPVTVQSPTLSSQDKASLNTALTALSGVLVSIQTQFAANPQLATQDAPAVVATLQGIGNTLAMIVSSANGTTSVAPTAAAPGSNVAQATPVAPSAPVAIAPATPAAPATTPVTNGTTPVVTAPAAPQSNPQVAQVSTSWSWKSLNWPLVIVVLLIVAAIVLWLWWPSDEDDNSQMKKKVVVSPSSTPVKPTVIVQPTIVSSAVTAPTPLATAMGASAQKPQAPQNGPTMDQKRKPA